MILAGDVGGTKTNIAVFERYHSGKEAVPVKIETFFNNEFESLEHLIKHYLSARDENIDRAVFAVAGPVIKKRAKITNLEWALDEERLADAIDVPTTTLINDLEATAYAVPFLAKEELFSLNAGIQVRGATIAVIAPGTGLGESFLTWDGGQYHAHATEGSHVDFAPTNRLQMELLEYLFASYEHVSYERVCSGIGIPNIYTFLKQRKKMVEPDWLGELLSSTSDPTAIIIDIASDDRKNIEICKMTLDIFLSILGVEAGNLALKVMARGGVYIGGGIPPRILTQLKDGPFINSFRAKGRMSQMLADFPVKVIMNSHAAVYGAARYGSGEIIR